MNTEEKLLRLFNERQLQMYLKLSYGFSYKEVKWIIGREFKPPKTAESKVNIVIPFWEKAFAGDFKNPSRGIFQRYQALFPILVDFVLYDFEVPESLNKTPHLYWGFTNGINRKKVQKSVMDIFFFFRSMFNEWWKYPGFIPGKINIPELSPYSKDKIEQIRQKCLNHSIILEVLSEQKAYKKLFETPEWWNSKEVKK